MNLKIADQYYTKGKYKQAERVYQKLLLENPKFALAYQGLGQCYVRTHRLDEAYAMSKKALDLDGGLTGPLITLGTLHLLNDEIDEAESMARSALSLDPNQADAYIVLGLVYLRRDKFQDSEFVLRKAIELDSTSWLAHLNLGVLYRNQFEFHKAHQEFWLAFKICPNSQTRSALVFQNISLYGTTYTLFISIFAGVSFILHSFLAWLAVIVVIGYCLIMSGIFLSWRKYIWAIVSILMGVLEILFFIYTQAR